MVRIVFCGTSLFAVPSLQKLLDSGMNVVGVVTQPDRPQGRGRKLKASPVKELAIKKDIPVFQPDKIKSPDSIAFIQKWQPGLMVVVSYGQILPVELLEYPRYGSINVHASLLPEYRGAAPIQRVLLDGKKQTGISIMFMDKGLDTGDIIVQESVAIDNTISYDELELLLADVGAELLVKTIFQLEKGTAPRHKQNNEQATYAHMISAADESIDWSKAAVTIHNQIRALNSKPGAYTVIDGKKLKIFKTRLVENNYKKQPGEVVSINNNSFSVQTGKGILEILEVQKEGKKRMSAGNFLKGMKLEPGNILGRD